MQSPRIKDLMKHIGVVVKTIISLPLLLMAAVGLFFGVMLLIEAYEPVSMRLHWQPTPCRITASEATPDWQGKHVFTVEYVCKLGP